MTRNRSSEEQIVSILEKQKTRMATAKVCRPCRRPRIGIDTDYQTKRWLATAHVAIRARSAIEAAATLGMVYTVARVSAK